MCGETNGYFTATSGVILECDGTTVALYQQLADVEAKAGGFLLRSICGGVATIELLPDVRQIFWNDATPAVRWQAYSYVLPDWQQSAALVEALRRHLPDAQQPLLADTVTNFDEGKQVISVMLIADLFISCLFFLAAGSAIYFKLFTQEEEDRRQLRVLERIGFQRREVARLLNREFLLLFLLPISLAIVHGVVALIDLAHVMEMQHESLGQFPQPGVTILIMRAFVPVSLLYLVGYMAFFWIARVGYLRRMRLATA